jgi:ribonuclease P protein component
MKKSLTRRERLSGKREIEVLLKCASRIESGGVKLIFQVNGRGYNRILITVRRGFRTAVARNRQKRILREIYRNSKSGLKQGFDLAFIIKREKSSFNEMHETLARLFQQACLLDGKKNGMIDERR